MENDAEIKYTDEDYLRAIILSENVSRGEEGMAMTGSSVINRSKANRPKEFGSNVKEVIESKNSPYYAASTNMYQEALTGNISGNYFTKEDYDKASVIASELLSGKREPSPGMFFFTPDEETKLRAKGKKVFNFENVKPVGEASGYNLYSY